MIYNPTISIVIPVYNVSKYIVNCLKSVIGQTYNNIEIIVVDDKGNDNSMELVRQFFKDNESSYKIIEHQINRGLSAARNSGIENANGDYIFFLDSDDELYPSSIESLVLLANKYPEVDIVQGNAVVQNNTVSLSGKNRYFYEYIDKPEVVRSGLICGYPMTAWNKLIRINLLKDNHIRFFEGILHEDEMFRWELHLYVNSIAFSRANTYWYRTDNQSSIMRGPNQLRSLHSSIIIVKTIAPLVKNRSEIDFMIYNLKLRKASRIAREEDKESITNEINSLRKTINLPLAMRFELLMWNLPFNWLKSTIVIAICAAIRKTLLFVSFK